MGVNREIAEFVRRDPVMPAVQSQKEEIAKTLSERKSSSAELPLLPATENQATNEIDKLDSLGGLGRLKAYTLDKFNESAIKLAAGVQNLFSSEKRKRGIFVVLQELNIFKYAVDGIIDPIFGIIDWGREELTCLSLNCGRNIANFLYPDSKQALSISYSEFRQLEKTENLLKWSKTLFSTAEVLLSLAATLVSAGSAAGHTAVKARGFFAWIAKEQPKFIALLNRLKVSAYFGGAGAVSEELIQGENSDFNFQRTLESTKVGIYYSLRFGAITSRLPGQMGKHLDLGDALGDLHEVAFTDTTRVFKTDLSGNLPSAKTIARRLLGLAGKTKVTLADLKDEAGNEIRKIYENENSKDHILNSIAQERFVGNPYSVSAHTAATCLYREPASQKKITGSVLEYQGQEIAGRNVIYRFWPAASWQELLKDLSLENTCNALTYFAAENSDPSIINIALNKNSTEIDLLRAILEEVFHITRGYQSDSQHEFTAKLYTEAQLKSLGLEHRSPEQILTNILTHYQYNPKDIANAIQSAHLIVPDLDLREINFTTPEFASNSSLSKLSDRVAASHSNRQATAQPRFFEQLVVPGENRSFTLTSCIDCLKQMGTESICAMTIEEFIVNFSQLAGLQGIIWGYEERVKVRKAYEQYWDVAYNDIDALISKHFPNSDTDFGQQLRGLRQDLDQALESTTILMIPPGFNYLSIGLSRPNFRQDINRYTKGIAEILNICGIRDPWSSGNIVFNRDLMIQNHMWNKSIALLMLAQGVAQVFGEVRQDHAFNFRIANSEVIKLELLIAFALGGFNYVEEVIHLQRRLHQRVLRENDGNFLSIEIENIYRAAQNGELFSQFGSSPVWDGKVMHWSHYWSEIKKDDWESSDRSAWPEVQAITTDFIDSKIEKNTNLNVLLLGGSEDGIEALWLKNRYRQSNNIAFTFARRESATFNVAYQLKHSAREAGLHYIGLPPELLTRYDMITRPGFAVVFHSLEHTPLRETASSLHHLLAENSEVIWILPVATTENQNARSLNLINLSSSVEFAHCAISFLSNATNRELFLKGVQSIQTQLEWAGLSSDGLQESKAYILANHANRREQLLKQLQLDLELRLSPRFEAYYERYKPVLPYGERLFFDPREVRGFFDKQGFEVKKIRKIGEAKKQQFYVVELIRTNNVPSPSIVTEPVQAKLLSPDQSTISYNQVPLADQATLELSVDTKRSRVQVFSDEFLSSSPLDQIVTAIDINPKSRDGLLQGNLETKAGSMSFSVFARGDEVMYLLSSMINPELRKTVSSEFLRIWFIWLKSRGFNIVNFEFFQRVSGDFLKQFIGHWAMNDSKLDNYITDTGLRLPLAELDEVKLKKPMLAERDLPLEPLINYSSILRLFEESGDVGKFIVTRAEELIRLAKAESHYLKDVKEPNGDFNILIKELTAQKVLQWSLFLSWGHRLHGVAREIMMEIEALGLQNTFKV